MEKEKKTKVVGYHIQSSSISFKKSFLLFIFSSLLFYFYFYFDVYCMNFDLTMFIKSVDFYFIHILYVLVLLVVILMLCYLLKPCIEYVYESILDVGIFLFYSCSFIILLFIYVLCI